MLYYNNLNAFTFNFRLESIIVKWYFYISFRSYEQWLVILNQKSRRLLMTWPAVFCVHVDAVCGVWKNSWCLSTVTPTLFVLLEAQIFSLPVSQHFGGFKHNTYMFGKNYTIIRYETFCEYEQTLLYDF